MSNSNAGSGKPAGRSGDLQPRIISSIVLIAVALAATWMGGAIFRLFAALIAAAVFYEWSAMTRAPGAGFYHAVLAVVLALFLLALLIGFDASIAMSALALAVVIGLAAGLVLRQGLWPAGGVACAGLAALSLAALRGQDVTGLSAIVFVFAIVWATDILAYFFGRALGGPKLAPRISPGKTWSGAVGGAVSGTVAGVAAGILMDFSEGWLLLAVLALVLSVVSQLGDLSESLLKRRFAAKDSGNLIPGHGGVMDRVDGLIAAAVLLWLIAAALGGLDEPGRAFFAPYN